MSRKPITRKMAVDCLLWRFMPLGSIPCGICGEPLKPGDTIQFDHIHAVTHQGPHEYQNLRPVHYDPCHKKKSARDVKDKAKIDRIRGETCTRPSRPIPSRPMQSGQRKWPARKFGGRA